MTWLRNIQLYQYAVYRFARRLTGICSLQIGSMGRHLRQLAFIVIGRTEICVVFGSHACWQ
jgi:hypothetical protein